MEGWKETEIGLLPSEWDTVNFSNYIDCNRGISWRKVEEADPSNGGVLVVSIPNIKDGYINFNSKYNHYIKKNISEKKQLKINDILCVGSSGSIHNIGRNTLITWLPFQKIAFASFTFNIRRKNTNNHQTGIISDTKL